MQTHVQVSLSSKVQSKAAAMLLHGPDWVDNYDLFTCCSAQVYLFIRKYARLNMFMYVALLYSCTTGQVFMSSWEDCLVFVHWQCGKEDVELPNGETQQMSVCLWTNQHCRDKDTDSYIWLLVELNPQLSAARGSGFFWIFSFYWRTYQRTEYTHRIVEIWVYWLMSICESSI